jgi:hypothetical protein
VLTAAGQQVVDACWPEVRRVAARLSAGFSAQERRALLAMLERYVQQDWTSASSDLSQNAIDTSSARWLADELGLFAL